MRENRISIRALMVLAAELGAEHFYGVRDPFLMMDADEIRAAYELCLDELERAEIITRQLEGISVVRDDLRRHIQICMDCDRYLTKDAISAGHELPSYVFINKMSSGCVCAEKEMWLVWWIAVQKRLRTRRWNTSCIPAAQHSPCRRRQNGTSPTR